jgi:hypothetical protein
MRFLNSTVLLIAGTLLLGTLHAQVQFVPDEYFPADMEFRELRSATPTNVTTDGAALSKMEAGKLISEVGFERLARKAYAVDNSGSLTIEIFTLKDARAAYSVLTLLRGAQMLEGPPGNAYSLAAGKLLFAHGSRWVRIQGRNIPPELLRRVATSVSNRMGPTTSTTPSLIRHFPRLGFDASSVRYFLEPQSFEENSLSLSGALGLKFFSDMEIAQAQYALDNKSGILSLISFPTSQMAEDYFESATGLPIGPAPPSGRVYIKKAGPLLAVLEGSFDPGAADNILSALQFAYSIKWIYDRNNRSDVAFGVPIRVLGTVVFSLLFVALLGMASIVVGIGLAFLRIGLRTYAPNSFLCRHQHNAIISLKLDEN